MGTPRGTGRERDGKGACSHVEGEANPWAKRRGWLALLLLARSWTPRGSNNSSGNNNKRRRRSGAIATGEPKLASPRLATAPAVASGRDRSGHQPYPTLLVPGEYVAAAQDPTERRKAGTLEQQGQEAEQERRGEMAFSGTQQKCKACDKTVYLVDQLTADGVVYHKSCFRCHHCKGTLKVRPTGLRLRHFPPAFSSDCEG